MIRIIILFLLSILAYSCNEPVSGLLQPERSRGSFRIMFWNTENLFDCFNDSLCLDEEFLPYGIRTWTAERYKRKIRNIYKVIIAAGEWQPPELIGLCEVENNRVLYELIRDTPFSYFNYRFVHFNSPDRRGIDVALLYDPQRVDIIIEKPIPVKLSDKSRTRDILYTRMAIYTGDTLSVYVNHWPSKYGGAGPSGTLRMDACNTLTKDIKSLLRDHPSEKIIIMGDFNDVPDSDPLLQLADAFNSPGKSISPEFLNLAENYEGDIPGSIKFEGAWQLIDQFFINRELFSGNEGLIAGKGDFRIFSPEFLLEKDEKFGGLKPFRTYSGFAYRGGYSDHLPVILDLFSSK